MYATSVQTMLKHDTLMFLLSGFMSVQVLREPRPCQIRGLQLWSGIPALCHTWVMLSSALAMLRSPKLWAPWATTVMIPPALLLITAGETRMEAMGGFKVNSYFCVGVVLYTVGGHYTVNVNKQRGYCLLSRNDFSMWADSDFLLFACNAGSICG